MTIASILALPDGGPDSERVLVTALEVGRAFGAHVECLYVEAPVNSGVPAFTPGTSAATVDHLIRATRDANVARREHLAELMRHVVAEGEVERVPPDEVPAAAKLTIAWRETVGHISREAARRGRVHDLIVVGPPSEDDGGSEAAALESAVLDTGRPVLMVGGEPWPVIGAPVTLAWDGSREAALVAALARPFLSQAPSVQIVSVGDAGRVADPVELARYLTNHGIPCATRLIAGGRRPVAELLVAEARRSGPGLLVMGAFGHSPLGERLFGGVTREAMDSREVPLLMAH